MSSNEDPKLDALRLKVSSALEWKGLKNLINLGTIQEIRQLSLNLQFKATAAGGGGRSTPRLRPASHTRPPVNRTRTCGRSTG